jgi:hypothetical protein
MYYQPVMDKEFDFVINPVVFEPVIQVMYEVKILVKRPPTPEITTPKPITKYILITPSGEPIDLNINN